MRIAWRIVILLAAAALCALAPLSIFAASPAAQAPWQQQVLKTYDISGKPADLLARLETRVMTADKAAEIEQAIQDLGSGIFDQREAATKTLLSAGALALGRLYDAAKSPDAEVTYRAKLLISSIKSGENRQVDELQLKAVFRELALQRVPGGTPRAILVFPNLESASLRRAAQETIYECAQPADLPLLEKAWRGPPEELRAAALVGLCKLSREQNLPLAEAALADSSAEVRLAACRVLCNSQPRACLPVLVELTATADQEFKQESLKFLTLMIGHQFSRLKRNQSAEAWGREIAELTAATKFLQLPDQQRYFWGNVAAFVEEFQLDQTIEKKYGLFEYLSPIPTTAKIVDGRLRLFGDHPETDQRLMITATDLFGGVELPTNSRVRVELGGEEHSNGAWHCAVAVGNAKFLFHPGQAGGLFRVERDDSHHFLSENVEMGFTPAPNVLHEMTLEIRQLKDQEVKFLISIEEGNGSGKIFTHEIVLEREITGPLSRIMLIRSGRTGGAALFDHLQIEELP
ncbi:MAG: HEAT repeat domain-containing protein [Pirellulales bacterium]|nr:HEAT repeat domain-containing protein [Pirellulales bacterium]